MYAADQVLLGVHDWPGALTCIALAICATIIIVKLFG